LFQCEYSIRSNRGVVNLFVYFKFHVDQGTTNEGLEAVIDLSALTVDAENVVSQPLQSVLKVAGAGINVCPVVFTDNTDNVRFHVSLLKLRMFAIKLIVYIL
jgi:hypothetical protein